MVPIIKNDDDGYRWYEIDGQKYISTTEVLDCVQPKSLQNWFKKTSPGQIEKKVQSSAQAGTDIHRFIQHNLETGEVTDVPEEYRKPFSEWIKVKERHKIIGIQMEQIVYSKRLGVAGTADIIGSFEGKPAIMDVKSGFYGVKAGWQMASYKLCHEETVGASGLDLVGLSIPRNGDAGKAYPIAHPDWCVMMFLSALTVWKGLNFYKLYKMEWPWLFDHPLSLVTGVKNIPTSGGLKSTTEKPGNGTDTSVPPA